MESSPEVLEKLKQIPLFSDIRHNDEYIRTFVGFMSHHSYKKGDVIIREGEIGSELFIVLKGSVEIQKQTRAGDYYTVAQLNAEQNIFFGEMALIDDDKRSATVIARENSDFLVITKNDFLKCGAEHPHIALPITQAISSILASRLRKTTSDMLTIFDALVNEIQ
ncbi:MAG: cyclic nucleotide-binding domain-containing protein [Spirochaetales bacterium]|nr:cyclic nucleotide-binding domain-containing protein [Spirochaetales bacterium]MCF7938487.1 cyclic nucleotide-binding domain-containing protein [Spirochaetales bacterium]